MYTIDPNDKIIATSRLKTTKPQSTPIAIGVGIKKNILIRLPAVYDATRFFDIAISFSCLIILLPVFLLIAFIIKASSRGPVIFSQKRVGKDDKDFTLYKFRTMQVNAAPQRSLTIGKRDNRVTATGYFLRRYKLDELPQLYNVLKNEMSIVGPRPELRKYVSLYSNTEREILFVKPGITDHASILFRNENELLALQSDPEQYYIETVVPIKIRLNKKYASDKTLKNYFIIILKTIVSVFR